MALDQSVLESLPQYRSHKVVRAAKIVGVSEGSLPLTLFRWHLDNGAVIDVEEALATRVPGNTSPIGGYLVAYEDGFLSWSPADAFEGGYTLITDG
jgi:hypothetical protein